MDVYKHEFITLVVISPGLELQNTHDPVHVVIMDNVKTDFFCRDKQ